MFELIVEQNFSSAHCLEGYDGPCQRMHGHNYKVELSVVGDQLHPTGYLVDFGDLKDACDAVMGQLDHRFLNDLPAFSHQNPTAENIARFIFEQLKATLTDPRVRVNFVRVWETPGQSAIYRED